MATFSFAPVVKKIRSHAESTSKYNIIIPNVEGIVFIDIKGNYYIRMGDDKYNIASESYSCKGVSEVYSQELDNGKVRARYIRSERDRNDMNRDMYLPFIAGCTAKGNIVRYKAMGTVIFKIKRSYLDFNDPCASEAIKFFRDNYIKIRVAINSRILENDIAKMNDINE